MKIRNGVDIVNIDRILKHVENNNTSFFKKCFLDSEYEYAMAHKIDIRRAESFAARFAAKEAAAKALGTGICTENIGFLDFEIVRGANGAPELVFHGEALKKAEELKVTSVSVSLSHDGGVACAFVTLLTDEE